MSLAVVDASTLVALLADAGDLGEWARRTLATQDLAAPHLVLFETANVLRRHARRGVLSEDQAALAHAELVTLPVELWPYDQVARRAWQLRANASVYDAAYLALAELLDAPLVTLDAGLTRVPGTHCDVLAPSRRLHE